MRNVRFFALVAAVLLADGVVAQSLGGVCNPDNDVDLFGCQDNYYMTCDPTSSKYSYAEL